MMHGSSKDLVLGVTDSDYSERFSQSFRLSAYHGRYRLIPFSDPGKAADFFRLRHPTEAENLFLVDPDWPTLPVPDGWRTIVLSDKQEVEKGKAVFRYQTVQSILDQASRLAVSAKPNEGNPDDPGVIGVISASGGAGKTVLSLNLARQLNLSGQEALYISLDPFGGYDAYVKDGDEKGRATASLLYDLRYRTDQAVAALKHSVIVDDRLSVACLGTADCPEWQELSEEDVGSILGVCKEAGYRNIVLDLTSDFRPSVIGALKAASRVYWLFTEGPQCALRTHRMQTALKQKLGTDAEMVQSRTSYLMNSLAGTQTGNRPAHIIGESFPIRARLPYIDEWDSSANPNAIFEATAYNDAVRKLTDDVIQRSGKVGTAHDE